MTDAAVDINIVSAENRRKKLLIADMDSTMIPVECIDELADFAGVKEQVSDITERSMRGELGFEESIIARVALLTDLPEAVLEKCYAERVSLNPGAKTLVQTMNKIGAMTALVSGGFVFFTSRVAGETGFQLNQANTLIVRDGKLTGKVGMPILGQQAKLETLNALCKSGGYAPEDVLAVGDGANDRSMVEAAGLGVAYHAKPTLADIADARLYHSDLTALLALQGIAERDYA
ncbi:phosphoserine phosphatase SerB [Rhodobacterales bacterium 52_120_T64]|nr:phosphoserine phosphatase SerB [Rhodobacterales bacterium 52_120_T64]